MPDSYHPEPYWNEVAARIAARGEGNVIAGDDEPYYEYKRRKFLQLLHAIPFEGRHVLEIGSGPGGNLQEISRRRPASLTGADISDEMLALAGRQLGAKASLVKINGQELPFPDDRFDLALTSTVLQHNSDEHMLKNLVAEICRVTREDVYIFEKIEKTIKGDALCMGRPVDYYAELFGQGGFRLQETRFLNIQVSYLVSGSLRKLLNPRTRKEGQPLSRLSLFLQKLTLPVTALADRIFTAKRDVAMLHFKKQQS